MPVDFTADDAALAVQIMTENAIADLPFVSRQQSDADFAKANAENTSLVKNLMKLHGLDQLGNPMDGEQDLATNVIA